MRNAPSVQYPVGRSRFYAGLLTCLGLLVLAVQVLWWWPLLNAGGDSMTVPAGQTGVVAGGLGALLWLAWALFAVFSWQRSPTGVLHWDAHAIQNPETVTAGLWRWHSAAYPDGTALQLVSLALDLQSRMLLRLRNNGVVHHTWVWVEEGSDPGRWGDLRRALVATRA